MAVRSLRSFGGGLSPRTGRRLLRNDQAQIALNAVITSGELVPLREPKTVYFSNKPGTLQSLHRLTDANGADIFLAWSEDVDAVRALIDNDVDQFVYYTGAGEPRKTSLAMATAFADNRYPNTAFVLGIVRPEEVPTIPTIGGGSAELDETRVYVYTFVAVTQKSDGSIQEEEGPPSLPVTATGKPDGSWTINVPQTSLNNSNTITGKTHAAGVSTITTTSTRHLRAEEYVIASSNRYRITQVVNATSFRVSDPDNEFPATGTWTREAPHNVTGMLKRIYRTAGGEDFFKVADVSLATTSYVDSVATVEGLPGDRLLSIEWEQPPADMKCLIALPNGSLAGISGTRLCLSEAGLPHAWPPSYRKFANYQGVSLGHLGQTIVMTTEGAHYVATGIDPSAITFEGAQVHYPCLSKRGTVSLPVGVAWPTHEGIAIQGPGGAYVITKNLFTKREWIDDERGINPFSIFAANYDGRYVASYQRPGSAVREIMILDPTDQSPLFGSTVQTAGLQSDRRNGKLYVLLDNSVREWDAGTRMQLDWQSKEFVEARPETWGAAKLDIDLTQTEEEIAALQAQYDEVAAANEAISASDFGWKGGEVGVVPFGFLPFAGVRLNVLPLINYEECGFYLYQDQRLVFYKRVTNDRAFRVDAMNNRRDNWSVRVITNVTARAIVLANNLNALAREGAG